MRPSLLLAVLALSQIIVSLVLLDRVGSSELFLSGLALLLLRDSRKNRKSVMPHSHARLSSFTMIAFALGFSILLLIGSTELAFFSLVSPFPLARTITGIAGTVLLLVGAVPYTFLVLRKAKSKQK